MTVSVRDDLQVRDPREVVGVRRHQGLAAIGRDPRKQHIHVVDSVTPSLPSR